MTVHDDRFIRRLVHDLRGPAGAIRDLPGWLREDMAGVAMPESADRICRLLGENAAQLDAVLDGLAAWVAAGDAPADPTPATDEAALLAALPSARGCTLEVDTAPFPLAASDLANIGTCVFDNLHRFHPGACPRVLVQGVVRGSAWTLTFQDDGPGPPVRDANRLLAPLARAAVGPQPSGAGFGLAVVARIAARYGATVNFGAARTGTGAVLRLSTAISDPDAGQSEI